MKALTSKKLRSIILETLSKTKTLKENEDILDLPSSDQNEMETGENFAVIEALTKAIKAVGGVNTRYGKIFKGIRTTIRNKLDPALVEEDFALLKDRANDVDFLEFDLSLDPPGQKAFKDAVSRAGKKLSSMHKAKADAGIKKASTKAAAKSAIAKYTDIQTEEEMIRQIQKTVDEKGLPEWKEIYSGGGAKGWSDPKWKEFLDTARQKGLVSQSIATAAAKSWPEAAKALGMKGNLKGAEALYQIIASGDSQLKDKNISENYRLSRKTIRQLILQEIKRSGGL